MLGQGRQENSKGPRPIDDDSGELGDAPRPAAILNAIYNKFVSRKNGTKEHPTQTCAELFRLHKNFTSGLYWIDPDGDETSNAIQVYCNQETHATCLNVQPNVFTDIQVGGGGGAWISDLDAQINYKSDSRQIRLLQLLSDNVSQSFTIQVIGSDKINEKIKR